MMLSFGFGQGGYSSGVRPAWGQADSKAGWSRPAPRPDAQRTDTKKQLLLP